MKISASIYANSQRSLQDTVSELDRLQIDMLHIDCTDDLTVFDDIRSIRKYSQTPIDLHLITDTPQRYFDAIEELGIEYVSLQFEHLKLQPVLPHFSKTKWGLSVQADTPSEQYEGALTDYSFMLYMSTTPGVSGGRFSTKNFKKINELLGRFPKIQLHVDGGITNEIAFVLRLMGVRAVVSGSYLMNQSSLGVGLMSLHRTPGHDSDIVLSDFCFPAKYLPVLKEHECNFEQVLQTIEQYKLGFVLLVNEFHQLTGVVTNADIRKGLLKYGKQLFEVNPTDFVNRNPIILHKNNTLQQMIQRINELNFIILFLPVVDDNKNLEGAVLLNNLTRI